MTRPTADDIDIAILRALQDAPTATVVAIAERTGLARNTVRSRLDRYAETLGPFDRRIDPALFGFPLRAYVMTTVRQSMLDEVGASLTEVPEVLAVEGLSGISDLLILVAARDADDLYRIAGEILHIDGVKRTSTALVMRDMVPRRIMQLAGRAKR